MARTESRRTVKRAEAEEARRGLTGQFVFSYLMAAGLLAAFVYRVGGWGLLALTRLLWVVNRVGIIPFNDMDTSITPGAPPLEKAYQSRDAVDWLVVLLVLGLFLLALLLKSVQFHGIARAVGIEGGFGQHARAYLYGTNVNRFLPFNVGNVATASALEGQGASLERGALAVFMSDVFILIEIAVFTLLTWRMLGVTRWIAGMAWPVGILLAAYVFVRPARRRASPVVGEGAWASAKAGLRVLAQQPTHFIYLTALSLASFTLEVFAAYWVAQAFSNTSETGAVMLNIPWGVALMVVLGWYIARRVPLTPGGIGLGIWGFSLAAYSVGGGIAAAGTVAVIFALLRYLTGGLVIAGVVMGKGVETNLTRTFQLFKGEGVPASLQPELTRV